MTVHAWLHTSSLLHLIKSVYFNYSSHRFIFCYYLIHQVMNKVITCLDLTWSVTLAQN